MAILLRALLIVFTLAAQCAYAVVCDADNDSDIDRNDLNLIGAARGTNVAAGDPRDADRDGKVTVIDGRICAQRCTLPGCAVVSAVNHAPSFTKGPDQTVLEDAGAQTVAGWATAIDDGDPAVQTLTFNVTGNTNTALFSAGPAVSATGTLTYTPAANANGSATITLTLSDNGGTAGGGVDTSAPQTLVINVTAVNDVPSFTKGPDQTVAENAGAQTVAGWATAIADGDPEVAQTLTFTVTGNTNPALFSAAPAVSATGTLTYTPAAATTGTATITLRVSDNGGTANGGVDTSATQSFVITVNAVNHAPSFTKGPNQTVLEDAGAQTVASWATAIDDGDPAVQTLTFNVTGNTNPTLFSAGPAVSPTGTLTYTPAANANGSATITLTLSDNGGTANGGADTSAPQTFVINVTAVNDAPTATIKSHQTHSGIRLTIGAANTGKLKDGATDVDDPFADLTVSASFTSVTPAGATIVLTDAATGTFTYNPPAGYSGAASFQYQVCDDGVPVAPVMCSAPTTVNFSVTGPDLWFVQQGASGTGRLTDPLGSLAGLPAGRGTGDRIFVFTGNYAGHTLATGEHLIGQGSSGTFDAVLAVSVPANGTLDARPALGGTRPALAGTVIVASNSVTRGLNINPAAATRGLTNNGITATGVAVSEVSITTSNAAAADLNANTDGTFSLTSVSANGGANGILIQNTGPTFSFSVAGAGTTAGSGGTIQNATGTGIVLSSTRSVNLSNINVQNSGDDGINGANVAGFSLTGVNVTNNGNSTTDEGIELTNPVGAIVFINVTATGNAHNNIFIDDANNVGGNSTLTMSGGTIGNHRLPDPGNTANSGLLATIRGTAVLGVSTISGVIFENNRALGLQVTGGDTANVSDLTISGNTFRDTGTGNSQEISMDIAKAQSSSMTVKVLTNTVTGHNSHGMNFFTGADVTNPPAGTYNARIEGNIIGSSATAGSGSRIGNCIRINVNGGTDTTVLVNNNTLRECPVGRGIEVIGRNGTGGLDVTVTNNDVNHVNLGFLPGTSDFPLSAIVVQSNCVGVCNTVRSDVRGNTVPVGTAFDLLSTYITLVETNGNPNPPGSTSTLELVDTAPASASCTAQLTSTNTGSASANAGCALIAGPISTPP